MPKFRYDYLNNRLWRIENEYACEIGEDSQFRSKGDNPYGGDGFILGENEFITFNLYPHWIRVFYQRPTKSGELVYYRQDITINWQLSPTLFNQQVYPEIIEVELTEHDQVERIGELHSFGRQVVGIGSIHEQGKRYTLKGRSNVKFSLTFEKLAELQNFLTQRNIFTTSWGKIGKENIGDLELFQQKSKKTYQQKKRELEELSKNSKQKFHLCYLCLVSFQKSPAKIKEHLNSKNHLQKLKKLSKSPQKDKNILLKKPLIFLIYQFYISKKP